RPDAGPKGASRAPTDRAGAHRGGAPRTPLRCAEGDDVNRAPVVLAVDGGGSKTDLALIHADGTLLSLVRGPKSSPHLVGLDGALEVLDELLRAARIEASLDGDGQVAEVAELLMAGVDFPSEEAELRDAVERRGWAAATSV